MRIFMQAVSLLHFYERAKAFKSSAEQEGVGHGNTLEEMAAHLVHVHIHV